MRRPERGTARGVAGPGLAHTRVGTPPQALVKLACELCTGVRVGLGRLENTRSSALRSAGRRTRTCPQGREGHGSERIPAVAGRSEQISRLRLRSEARNAARLDVADTASVVGGTRNRSIGTAAWTNVCFGVRDDALSAATARGQWPRRRGTAADEGNSSKGMSRVVGKARDAQGHSRVDLADRGGNTANLMAGSGMQQARSTRVEQAVKAVRNREGGTRPDRWHCPAEGSPRAPGSGHPGEGRWRGVSGRIPGEEGETPARRERFEVEPSCRGPADDHQIVNGRARVEDLEGQPGDGRRSRRSRGRPTTRYTRTQDKGSLTARGVRGLEEPVDHTGAASHPTHSNRCSIL